jgi:hypothetical protein
MEGMTMPDPRPLGNKARDILTDVESALLLNQREFFTVVLELLRENREAAIERLQHMADRNEVAARAITLLRVNDLDQAAAVIRQELDKQA